MSIVQEKVDQAVGLLDEFDIDCWLTFARETTETGDPVLPLILGQPVTWQSALIVTRSGDRIAIVGKYEDEAVQSTGAWSRVVPYVEGIRAPLREILGAIDPQKIAINYSVDDVKADGLSHGMFLLLHEHLAGTPYVDRLTSAESIVTTLRGRKTRGELERLRAALDTTNEIFRVTAARAQPGMPETDVSALMHHEARQRDVGMAWEAAMCPIVMTGPDSMVGHGLPSSDLSVTPGRVFHLDFGVQQAEYCSDIQRAWYVAGPGETAPPEDVQRAFDAVASSILAAAKTLRPGVEGWQVDDAARSTLVDAGYPEYQHATGHQVGRAAHDGGAVLGPKWERYGRTPHLRAEVGNVFTLELGVDLPDRGYLGLEEMVLVTEDGCEWLSARQDALPLLGAEPKTRIC